MISERLRLPTPFARHAKGVGSRNFGLIVRR